ncbi:dirigent protein 7 [Nymphaea colorata]|uniref:Dirigent protein n=1 Tax=Nymphaea colorata TaxID=210225 RepID=A0A5K1B9E6_9MAGN|nr:dirigent protein 7 [Nymphaea colorata]
MLPKVIFLSAVAAATLCVVLLAVLSPAHRSPPSSATNSTATAPKLFLSLYLQPPSRSPSPVPANQPAQQSGPSALVFRRAITEHPGSGSPVVGRAQGFVVPADRFPGSGLDVVYLTIDTTELSGGLAVRSPGARLPLAEDLPVVGGTGSFAFARGTAAFVQSAFGADGFAVPYRLKLRLQFPDRSPMT